MSALSSAGETGLLVAFPQSEAGNLNSVLLVTEEGVADFHLLMNARLVAISTIKDQPTKVGLSTNMLSDSWIFTKCSETPGKRISKINKRVQALSIKKLIIRENILQSCQWDIGLATF